MWAPWGPGVLSCIESCPHFRDNYVMKAYLGHIARCALKAEVSQFQGYV